MKYKVVINKCNNPQIAAHIAEIIASRSGSSAAEAYSAVMNTNIVIHRDATQEEAGQLKQQFESVGASVQVIPANGSSATVSPNAQQTTTSAGATNVAAQQSASVAAPGSVATSSAQTSLSSYDDDDEEDEGKVISEEEYARRLKERADVFVVEDEKKDNIRLLVSIIFAILAGLWLSTREIIETAPDFFAKIPEERAAKIVKNLPETLQKEEKKDKKKEEEIKTEKKKLKPSKKKGAGGRTGGGGDPRARVTKKGVLGIISGQVKGRAVASADIFGKGGFATGIDAVLSGVGGLKAGGSGGVGRKGAAGIGYGAGYGSGFGGGSGGIDDLIGSLMGGDGGSLSLKKRGKLKISAPKFTKGGALTGGRSRASIMRVVMQNLAALRYAYNKRLREKPGLRGKITVKFAIDEFGNVIYAKVMSSTMNDPVFEKTVVSKIKRWKFDKIDKPGDVTEVVYPFVFSQ